MSIIKKLKSEVNSKKRSISLCGPYVLVEIYFIAWIFEVLGKENQIFLPSVGDEPVGFFPVQSGSSVFSAWGVFNLGTPAQNGSGKFLLYVLQNLVHSAFLGQLVVYSCLFGIASIGLIFAFRQLGFAKNPYIIIPIAISLSLNWTLFQTLQLLEIGLAASFPFLVLFGVRAVNGIGKRRWNVLGLTVALLIATSFANVVGFGIALYVLLPIVLARIIISRKLSDLIQLGWGLITMLAALVTATLIALPFFYQGYYLLLGGGFQRYVNVSSGGSLTSSSPLSLLQYMRTLMPTHLSPFLTASSPMLDNVFWPLGLLIVIFAAIGLFNKNRLQRSLSIAFMLLLIALTTLVYLILSNQSIVNELYARIPLLFVLIEAQNYGYTMTPIWIFLAGLGIVTLESLSSVFRRRVRLIQIAALCFALLILLSTISAFNFAPLNFSSAYQTPLDNNGNSYPAQPPQEVVNLFLNLQSSRATIGPFRVLWLPYPLWFSQVFYAEGTPDVLNLNSLGNLAEKDALISTLNEIVGGNVTNVGRGLALFDFKYIVVPLFFADNEQISYQTTAGNSPVQIVGDPTLFENILSKQKDLRLIESRPAYLMYENLEIPNDSSGVFWLSTREVNLSNPNDVFLDRNLEAVKIVSMSPTYTPSEYELAANVSSPSWLIFDQTFDNGWVAKIDGNNTPLNHTSALGWANAFYIPKSGIVRINLLYEPQLTYNLVWIFSESFTIFLVVLYAVVLFHERKKLRALSTATWTGTVNPPTNRV